MPQPHTPILISTKITVTTTRRQSRYTGGGEFAGYIGSNIDLTDLKRAEEERERLRQAQADLAHINRVTTMGELTASLAHEIKQPVSAAATDAGTCLRWLSRDHPDVEEAREAASRVIRDVTRASEIINRVRLLFKKGEPQRELVDLNEVIREMIVMLRNEASRSSISGSERESVIPPDFMRVLVFGDV
jgi:C4-dicarboxylate-specific signal transduction histidine kinase